MDIGLIVVIIIFVIAVLVMYRNSRKKTSNSEEVDVNPKNTSSNIFENREKKPSEEALKLEMGDKKYNDYLYLKNEFEKLGTPDLLWRGQTHGWVLSLIEGSGTYGSVILKHENLIGNISLSRNRLYGMRSDPRFPKIFSPILDSTIVSRIFLDIGTNYEYDKIELDTEEKIKEFPKIIELCTQIK